MDSGRWRVFRDIGGSAGPFPVLMPGEFSVAMLVDALQNLGVVEMRPRICHVGKCYKTWIPMRRDPGYVTT
jgi:hypothetical protein